MGPTDEFSRSGTHLAGIWRGCYLVGKAGGSTGLSDDGSRMVTLLTDFGLSDHYVGVMKGVLLGLAPAARIVDISHQVSPQAVGQASFLLAAAAPYFPPGTIHVAVVDPGVGSDRKIVCAVTETAVYLAPDNGLLTRVLLQDPAEKLIEVDNSDWFLDPVSNTFHGRDVFAPVAAHLANGVEPEQLGSPLTQMVKLPHLDGFDAESKSTGEILHVDHFGNLVTNVPSSQSRSLKSVKIGGVHIPGPISRSYADRAEGELLLVEGSSGFLEVSVRGGRASDRLRVGVGDPVVLEFPS